MNENLRSPSYHSGRDQDQFAQDFLPAQASETLASYLQRLITYRNEIALRGFHHLVPDTPCPRLSLAGQVSARTRPGRPDRPGRKIFVVDDLSRVVTLMHGISREENKLAPISYRRPNWKTHHLKY
jgi:hypothetical protein